ncbi:MAG TPA: hypothetical protein VJB13_00730, partial [Candidatus Nanoarchaeia archaeon]|nr:hypothetical protein [Candidatus Nanoarchaeia archaeon]
KIIQEHNIANLSESFVTEHPAENGLHNVSFAFVHQLISQGKEAEEVYQQLIAEELSLQLSSLIP